MKISKIHACLAGCGFIATSLCFFPIKLGLNDFISAAHAQENTVSAFDQLPAVSEKPNAGKQAIKDSALPVIVDEKSLPPAPMPNASTSPVVQVLPSANNSASVSTIAPAKPLVTSAAPTNAIPDKSLLPKASSGAVNGTNVMGDSGAKEKHSGTYYDADALVPDSELSNSGVTGPRKVDPAYEPGGKFIVVEKGASASSFEGQYVSATRALRLGRYPAAMEMFEKLYKRNHHDPRVLMGLALSQQGAGFNESAAKTYEDLLDVQPNNADAIVNLMGIMSGQYPSVTLKKLGELRDKYPSNPGIPAQMGLIYAKLGQFQDSLKYYSVAASMDPSNSLHIYNMAIVSDKKGDVKGAIELYERALTLDAASGSGEVNSLPRDQVYDRLVVLRRKV